jgi:hypothetical protein
VRSAGDKRAGLLAGGLGAPLALLVGAVLLVLVLPRPTHRQLVATETARWLIRYRLSSSSERLGGRVLHGLCLSSWFQLDGERGRGDLLVLGDATVLLDVRAGRRHLRRVRFPPAMARRLDLAGCPRRLAALVDDSLQSYSPRFVTPAAFAGSAALALRLRHQPYELILYVNPRNGYPYGLRSGSATSTISLERLTPRKLARLQAEPILPRPAADAASRPKP